MWAAPAAAVVAVLALDWALRPAAPAVLLLVVLVLAELVADLVHQPLLRAQALLQVVAVLVVLVAVELPLSRHLS